MSTTTHDIVAKLWNLCNILKDDGVTYHQYVTELTYLLFLKMAKETGTEEQIPAGYRWDDLEGKAAPDRMEFYRLLLIHLGSGGSRLVQEILVINFNYCKFLDHLGVAFLGGIIHLIEKHRGHFTFDWDTLSPMIRMNLAQNGFLQEFSGNIEPWQGNSVPFRYDVDYTGGILQYLEEHWLGRNWINISTQLQKAIVGNVFEIYANAFDHSQSPIGIFSCGQHYPNEKRLALTAIDFGVGIVSNVRSMPHLSTVSTEEALRWAFQEGNSTRTGPPGGNGLTLLHSFIAENRGTLTICTNDGKVEISDGKEYTSTNRSFSGTLVNIDLQCDESAYCLSTESQPF